MLTVIATFFLYTCHCTEKIRPSEYHLLLYLKIFKTSDNNRVSIIRKFIANNPQVTQQYTKSSSNSLHKVYIRKIGSLIIFLIDDIPFIRIKKSSSFREENRSPVERIQAQPRRQEKYILKPKHRERARRQQTAPHRATA